MEKRASMIEDAPTADEPIYAGREVGPRRLPVLVISLTLVGLGAASGAFGGWQFVQSAQTEQTTSEQQAQIDYFWEEFDRLAP